jgi:phosphate transport system substrate-binding protein
MNKTFFQFLALIFALIPFTSNSVELNGVGRRIPASIFSDWAEHYAVKNATTVIKYKAVNTTEGIKQVELGSADFGETDVPLTTAELNQKGLAQFPYMISAITPIINIPGVYEGQMNLTGQILGDIFLGKISKWNDPAIVAINYNLKLPDEKIIVAHRTADGGGTYTLSSYLSKVNTVWAAKVGTGATLNWPTGIAMDNLYAMGDFIKKTPYSIGYSEIAYSRKNNLVYTKLKNSDGSFVSPHTGSIDEALQGIHWKAANGFNETLIDRPGAGSWPMTSASYIVIRKTSDNLERRQALLGFLGWGLRLGDMDITRLDFMAMDRRVLPQIRNSWNDTPLNIDGATVVNAMQVKELISSGVPVIDARIAAEYETAHIPGSKNVTYHEKSAKSASFNPQNDKFDLAKLPASKSAEVVFYCNAGACWKGYKAAVAAVNANYKKVLWMRGGMPEWIEKGYPTDSSFPETQK